MGGKRINRIYDNGILIAKECSKCHEVKPISEFYKHIKMKDGLRTECKQCKKKDDKQWREDNKKYKKELDKQWRENNPEYRKQYYEDNKEYFKEYGKQYYKNNKKHVKERQKQYYVGNKEYFKEYGKQWYESNKEYYKQKYDNKVQESIQEIYKKVTKKLYPHNGIQYGVIYGVHNTVTDRWYIGQTTTSFKIRYQGDFFKNKVNSISEESSRLLVEDIETYGEGSFQIHEVIDVAFSEEELDALEVYYIDKYKAYDEGYNSTRGNINGKRSYREN